MISRLIIFGCGGHARSASDIFLKKHSGWDLIFVDENARENEMIFGSPVRRELPDGAHDTQDYAFVALGDSQQRERLSKQFSQFLFLNIVSETCYVGIDAQTGEGNFLGNFCHIGPMAVIGNHTILNNACLVEHESQVGNFCHIASNATLSGRAKLGDHVFIGASATVIDKVSICSHVTIGAGSTVIADITEPGTYVGSPARKIN